ncbi:MAG: hypothetical protein ACOCPZ_00995 [Natrialbaceae archaeon]
MGTTDATADGTEDGSRSDADETGAGRRSDALGWLRGRVLDALVVTGWTLGLALLFLETGWPRWAFYAAVLGGAVWFAVALSPGAGRAGGESGREADGESSASGGG